MKGFVVEDVQHVQGFPIPLAAPQISPCHQSHHSLFAMEGVALLVGLGSLGWGSFQQLLRKPLHILSFIFSPFSF